MCHACALEYLLNETAISDLITDKEKEAVKNRITWNHV